MSPKQKKIALVVGGLVAAYLVYRYYTSSSSASTASGTTGDQAAQDYASLAGQEQSDVAGLQGQLAQLQGQEGSDIAGLTGQLGDLASQLANATIPTTVTNTTTQTIPGKRYKQLEKQLKALSVGEAKLRRELKQRKHAGTKGGSKPKNPHSHKSPNNAVANSDHSPKHGHAKRHGRRTHSHGHYGQVRF